MRANLGMEAGGNADERGQLSLEGFTEQPLVADGASELIADVFGDSGTHSRSDVDVEQAPFNACVEIEIIVATAG